MSNKNQTVTIKTEQQLDKHLVAQKRSQQKGPASRSDVNDSMPNVYTVPPKDQQRPFPAHVGGSSTSHPEETLGEHAKHKPTVAHDGGHHHYNQENDSLNAAQSKRIDRSYPGDAKEAGAGRVQQARQATHGKIQHSGNNGDDATGGSKLVRT